MKVSFEIITLTMASVLSLVCRLRFRAIVSACASATAMLHAEQALTPSASGRRRPSSFHQGGKRWPTETVLQRVEQVPQVVTPGRVFDPECDGHPSVPFTQMKHRAGKSEAEFRVGRAHSLARTRKYPLTFTYEPSE